MVFGEYVPKAPAFTTPVPPVGGQLPRQEGATGSPALEGAAQRSRQSHGAVVGRLRRTQQVDALRPRLLEQGRVRLYRLGEDDAGHVVRAATAATFTLLMMVSQAPSAGARPMTQLSRSPQYPPVTARSGSSR